MPSREYYNVRNSDGYVVRVSMNSLPKLGIGASYRFGVGRRISW